MDPKDFHFTINKKKSFISHTYIPFYPPVNAYKSHDLGTL